jgi:CheY-specific phosphatase CheX
VGPTIVDTLVDTLTKSTEEVFETMVFRTLTSLLPIEGDALRPQSNVVGTVGFAGGGSGLVAFYSTLDAAREIAGSMLGMEPADVKGEMADAIGEITNKMAQSGHQWAISVPTVTIGSDFYIKPLVTGRRVLIPFKMDGHEVFVELIMTQPSEDS